MNVFAKFVGQAQKPVTANTIGDIRSAMNAPSNVSITSVTDGKQLSDDTAVVEGGFYIIASKTEGSAKKVKETVEPAEKNPRVLKKLKGGEIAFVKSGKNFVLNGTVMTDSQFHSLVNSWLKAKGYDALEL